MNHTSKQYYPDKRNVLLVDEVDPVMSNLGGGHELPATRARLVPANLQPIMEKIEGEHVESSSIVAKPEEPIWGINLFATDHDIDDQKMRDLLKEAADHTTSIHDETSAREWADNYQFPEEYVRSDVACLRAAQRDFVSMIRRRLKILEPQRLNASRIGLLRSDNPERELLLDLADGMRVPLPTGFEANGHVIPTPLRSTYIAVSSAVNKMLWDVISQRLAFLLPYELAKECVPNLHLAKAHWTRKRGKASGRPLGDLSFVDGKSLNTVETKEAASSFYGKILHPTIEDIASMVGKFWEKTVSEHPGELWSNVRVWKMDLRGAYTLLSYRPESAGLFGMMLTDNLVYFQIAGI